MQINKDDVIIGKTITIRIPDEISDKLDWNSEDTFWCDIEGGLLPSTLTIGRVVRDGKDVRQVIKSLRDEGD